MNFTTHSHLRGKHAFLGASRYHWIRYSEEKLAHTYHNYLAVERGTQLHAFAETAIRLRVKLPDIPVALNQFVNDAIGFRMSPEQVLFYSINVFGTVDAIGFKNGELRIHDLKTGVTKTSMDQLEIYAALFCLEYSYNPEELKLIELRIYQGENINVYNPDPDTIRIIMNTIKRFDLIIEKINLDLEG